MWVPINKQKSADWHEFVRNIGDDQIRIAHSNKKKKNSLNLNGHFVIKVFV